MVLTQQARAKKQRERDEGWARGGSTRCSDPAARWPGAPHEVRPRLPDNGRTILASQRAVSPSGRPRRACATGPWEPPRLKSARGLPPWRIRRGGGKGRVPKACLTGAGDARSPECGHRQRCGWRSVPEPARGVSPVPGRLLWHAGPFCAAHHLHAWPRESRKAPGPRHRENGSWLSPSMSDRCRRLLPMTDRARQRDGGAKRTGRVMANSLARFLSSASTSIARSRPNSKRTSIYVGQSSEGDATTSMLPPIKG